MSPGNRSPISATTAAHAAGVLSSVTGSPNSLLYDSGLAYAIPVGSAAASRSFVDVLPVEPVTPITTQIGSRAARTDRATACSPAITSGTLTSVALAGAARARHGRARSSATCAPARNASATKSCPSR